MAYTTINKSTDYFNTKLYTGNAGTQAVTGVGFQPDMCWFKVRNNTDTHAIFDAVRGATKRIIPDNTTAEGTQSNGITSFDSDGFTSGGANITNGSGRNYASWNWLGANGTASNTDGSITSTVSANTTSGFSIVSYTGTGSNATVGHGLSSAPSIVLIKNRSASGKSWIMANKNIGFGNGIYLNLSDASASEGSAFNSTAPTTSVFTVGTTSLVNDSGNTYIAYCFAEKQGYSKFGSYTGNGNADGTFVYTGFKPAFVLQKCTSTSTDWTLADNKRPGYNETNKRLVPNESASEATNNAIDFLSNGFKCRQDQANANGSGETYIYMAFAESPFVTSTGIPTTAR